MPWSPLAMGILAGRYTQPDAFPEGSRASRWNIDVMKNRVTRRGIEVAQALSKIAAERGLSSSQLALLWVKDQPGVTSPIIGPRTGRYSTPWFIQALRWLIFTTRMYG
jgi:aryl-alcohol dehydrogenase-like predicted oxidoreductase